MNIKLLTNFSQVHELKKNGKNILVTEQNKKEYVKLYVNFRLVLTT